MIKKCKRLSAFVLALGLSLIFASCGGHEAKTESTQANMTQEATTLAPTPPTNPLTGIANLKEELVGKRPVAVMINNMDVAQSVQMGVSKADIVYETLTEGGVTRMMAVFQDYESAGQIGTIRSARYAFTDLAMGMDAIYVHAGSDPKYNKPHMANVGIDHLDLVAGASSAGFREKNKSRLSLEHTLYTTGERLKKTITSQKVRTDINDAYNHTFFQFEEVGAPAGGRSAQSVKVMFSPGYFYSDYTYDAANKFYYKTEMGKSHKDLATGQQLHVKNIFILFTDIPTFSDNYHTNANLSSGSGLYITEGTAVNITWKKGSAKDQLVFQNADGSDLKVNPGNSWINITKTSLKDKCVIQ